ncbi:MAG: alpha/beta fold hydrolase [Sinobacterium sp.]|nr:alpha/beta fold hydrolase [Sinobacterium sp.]
MKNEVELSLPENTADNVEDFNPIPIRSSYKTLPKPLAKFLTKAHDSVDPVSFIDALTDVAKGVGKHPADTVNRTKKLSHDMANAVHSSAYRILGDHAPAAIAPEKGDKRFKHQIWEDNAAYNFIMQSYLLTQEYCEDLVDVAKLDDRTAHKARFAVDMFTDALAPTNFFATNPEALIRAFETGGNSYVASLQNRLHDLRENNGWPSMVDDSQFKVGENMACSPGKVVFRNELIELIQYEPQTEKVNEIPLLYNPAWINRYYIMDLAPGKSFVEWAVNHGHTMFAISYRNPDSSLRDISFTDYMMKGPMAAIQVIQEITGQEKVNMVSVCLGATLTTCTMAYLNEIGKDWINSSTQLNSHIDFSIPGDLGVFADEDTIESLERRMEKDGYADGDAFSKTFNLLRGRDLIWNYVTSNWLMGNKPPAFDLLAWNSDSTRLPAKMHSYYLRKCYIENALAQNKMVLGGKLLRVDGIKQDCYIVGAESDHIVPWHSSYKATQLLGGKVRYVLSSSGHIAGMVNPPHPKSSFSVNEKAYPADPEQWLETTKKVKQSWWEDWAEWAGKRAGKKVAAPTNMGSEHYGVIGDAPGRYVTE